MSPTHHGGALIVLFSFAITSLAGVPANLPRLCYTGKNELAPSYMLPCFNELVDSGDVYSCCIAGDYCLANQACFNVPRGITYQKGCTASKYDDINCPRKCDTDQSKADWVGLIYCNGTNGTPKDSWVCQHPDNCFSPASNCPGNRDPQLEITRTTYCENIKHDKRWVAFEGKSPIKSTVSLPQPSHVEEWWSSHSDFSPRWQTTTSYGPSDPYAPDRPTKTLLDTTGMSTSGPSETASPGNLTAALPQETSLSKDKTIGMAVGLGAGIPLLLAVVGFSPLSLRRRHNKTGTGKPSNSWPEPDAGDRGVMGDENITISTSKVYTPSIMAELPAAERPAQIPEMGGSGIGDHKSPIASPLVSLHSDKGKVHGDGIENAPVYELPG